MSRMWVRGPCSRVLGVRRSGRGPGGCIFLRLRLVGAAAPCVALGAAGSEGWVAPRLGPRPWRHTRNVLFSLSLVTYISSTRKRDSLKDDSEVSAQSARANPQRAFQKFASSFRGHVGREPGVFRVVARKWGAVGARLVHADVRGGGGPPGVPWARGISERRVTSVNVANMSRCRTSGRGRVRAGRATRDAGLGGGARRGRASPGQETPRPAVLSVELG